MLDVLMLTGLFTPMGQTVENITTHKYLVRYSELKLVSSSTETPVQTGVVTHPNSRLFLFPNHSNLELL